VLACGAAAAAAAGRVLAVSELYVVVCAVYVAVSVTATALLLLRVHLSALAGRPAAASHPKPPSMPSACLEGRKGSWGAAQENK